MNPQTVEVPLWLVTAIVGLIGVGLVAAVRIGLQLVGDVRSLRELLVGVDGKNGIRGSVAALKTDLDGVEDYFGAKIENVEHDVISLKERMDTVKERLDGLEDRERDEAA